ncbi:hypothetical protein [Auraticoccus monumenti]|uniref:Uncharacterized protein n=1 Tax=Auraticoccus monumenti TaxID=675864 RepID=A0A1G6W4J3_9ACTN|nr:hypothetical protein [Auraticoccus monumenti]SDD60754.1 hypothetical protein SAMN04489747_1345 [Auraticoccus monumenti]
MTHTAAPPDARTRRERVVAAAVGALLLVGVLLAPLLGPDGVPLVSPPGTPQRLVVVGVPGLGVGELDPALLDGRPAVVGSVATDTAVSTGGCAADGWATLSAGAPASTGRRCAVGVDELGGVTGWREVQDAAATAGATLGRLGDSGCVAAVGSAAALGAARSDGTTAEWLPVADWVSGGYASACPVVLVDGQELFGSERSEAVAALADQPGTQVWVLGIGPGALRSDSAPRPFLAFGDGLTEGRLVGADGGEPRITDVAGTLRSVVSGTSALELLTVRAGQVGAVAATALVEQQGAQGRRDGIWAGLVVTGLALSVVALLGARSRLVRRLRPSWAVALAALPAGLQLTGLTWWWRLPSEPLAVTGVLVGTVLVALAARALATRLAAPAWLMAAAVSAGTLLATMLTTLLAGASLPGGLLSPSPGRAAEPAWLPAAAVLAVTVLGTTAGLLLRRRRHP